MRGFGGLLGRGPGSGPYGGMGDPVQGTETHCSTIHVVPWRERYQLVMFQMADHQIYLSAHFYAMKSRILFDLKQCYDSW